MNQLQSLHTFGLSALSQQLISLTDQSQIQQLQRHDPFFILGSGSNCVFVSDYAGTVVLNQLRGIEVSETEQDYLVCCGAGENWHQLVNYCMQQGIYGFENLALIPGTVGAAPIQNIGAYGREICEFIDTVWAVDMTNGERQQFKREACEFGYRESIFKQHPARWFITQVDFRLPKQFRLEASYGELKRLSQPTPELIFSTVCQIRQQKLPDPAVLGNAGSFFKNPVVSNHCLQNIQARYDAVPHFVIGPDQIKIPAAWLIEQAGFKGKEKQGIRCHPTQPLVLTNANHATGVALMSFAREIRDTVEGNFAIQLENEVRLVGRHGLVTL